MHPSAPCALGAAPTVGHHEPEGPSAHTASADTNSAHANNAHANNALLLYNRFQHPAQLGGHMTDEGDDDMGDEAGSNGDDGHQRALSDDDDGRSEDGGDGVDEDREIGDRVGEEPPDGNTETRWTLWRAGGGAERASSHIRHAEHTSSPQTGEEQAEGAQIRTAEERAEESWALTVPRGEGQRREMRIIRCAEQTSNALEQGSSQIRKAGGTSSAAAAAAAARSPAPTESFDRAPPHPFRQVGHWQLTLHHAHHRPSPPIISHHFPSPPTTPSSPQVVHWQLQDLGMLLGTDQLVFSSAEHPGVCHRGPIFAPPHASSSLLSSFEPRRAQRWRCSWSTCTGPYGPSRSSSSGWTT